MIQSTDSAVCSGPYSDPSAIFASTEQHYLRLRPGYPAVLLDHLAAIATGPILDLGSGPGVVALELAQRGCRVIAADPNLAMLNSGRRAAKHQGLDIEWRHADSGQLHKLRDLVPLGGVVMADAFHWMDRESCLNAVNGLIRPNGWVAVMGSRAAGTSKPWWDVLLDRIRDHHLGARRAAGPGAVYQEQPRDHESVLRDSPFSRIVALRADHRVCYTRDELVALQYTHAFSSPEVLGARQDAFEHDVRRTLAATEPFGGFITLTQAFLLVGHRE